MKFIFQIVSLFVLFVQAKSGCDIKFFEEDKDNWGNFSAGYLLGTHDGQEASIQTCPECMEFA